MVSRTYVSPDSRQTRRPLNLLPTNGLLETEGDTAGTLLGTGLSRSRCTRSGKPVSPRLGDPWRSTFRQPENRSDRVRLATVPRCSSLRRRNDGFSFELRRRPSPQLTRQVTSGSREGKAAHLPRAPGRPVRETTCCRLRGWWAVVRNSSLHTAAVGRSESPRRLRFVCGRRTHAKLNPRTERS